MKAISTTKNKQQISYLLILIQSFSLVAIITLWLTLREIATFPCYWVSFLIVSQFAWSLWSWNVVSGNFFDPYTVFLVAAYLFNGGKAILEIFHLNERGIETFTSTDGYIIFSFSTDTIVQALVLVLIGLGSLHFGALWAASRERRTKEILMQPSANLEKASRWVGWFLLFISFVPFVVTIFDKYWIVMKFGYFGLFQRAPETGFGNLAQVLASFMIPGVLFLLAGSKGRHKLLGLLTSIIILYSFVYMFMGTRLWWTMPLVAYVWLWHRRIAPIPKKFLLMGFTIIVFIVFPIIPFVRNLPGAQRLSLSLYFEELFSIQNPVITILQEMGGTLFTIAHTLELIPAIRDFDFGLGYIYSLLTILPNLFWDIHPTIAREIYSHWLTSIISPAAFYAGGGYGFSFIAEAYANFGWVGIPVILGFIGFLLARSVSWAERTGNPAKSAAIATFLAFFLIYARGESALVVRALIWYALFPYLLTKLFQKIVRIRL